MPERAPSAGPSLTMTIEVDDISCHVTSSCGTMDIKLVANPQNNEFSAVKLRPQLVAAVSEASPAS